MKLTIFGCSVECELEELDDVLAALPKVAQALRPYANISRPVGRPSNAMQNRTPLAPLEAGESWVSKYLSAHPEMAHFRTNKEEKLIFGDDRESAAKARLENEYAPIEEEGGESNLPEDDEREVF